jgi:predicted O-methyltransferase YrrM
LVPDGAEGFASPEILNIGTRMRFQYKPLPGGDDFAAAVAMVASPRMGTELVGPLLRSLVCLARAATVLEVGGGATTLYLLDALAENARRHESELRMLEAKQRLYDPSWADDEGAADRDGAALLTWLEADPPLARPEYYAQPYQPRCVSVDDVSSPFSAASRVRDAAEQAGLAHLLDQRFCDFRDLSSVLAHPEEVFDLAWFDCGGYGEYRDFLDLYWDRVRADGGMLVLHYTLTVPSHERVLTELAAHQETGIRGQFEMLSLLEPHKLMQNSVTLIRRTAGSPPRFPLTRGVSLERSV